MGLSEMIGGVQRWHDGIAALFFSEKSNEV